MTPAPRRAALLFALVASITSATRAEADAVIGIAVPSSGRDQPVGDAIRIGTEKAISDLNAGGGVLGEKLSAVVSDDVCSSDGAKAAAAQLTGKTAKLVVGHPCTKASLAAAQAYSAANTIYIAPASRHPGLTVKRAGKTIFRLSGRDDRQAERAAEWMLAQPGSAPLAIVHDKTSYSRLLAAAVSAALVAKGATAPLDFPIVASENVYPAVIDKLKDVKPRAVFFAGYPAEADIIVEALRERGIKAPILGSDSLATEEFALLRAARDPNVEVLSRYDPELGPQSTSQAAAAARHSELAVKAWAAAVQRANAFDADKVAAELSTSIAVEGLTFDANGDARVASFYPVRWSGTAWVARLAAPP